MSPHSKPSLTVPAALLALLATATASAQGADGARAAAVVKELSAKPEAARAAASFLNRARHALERARSARGAGDFRHAAELEALALELAETARDWVRARDAERELAELSRRALAAETRAVRAQALVEQTAARRGRAAAQLAALEAERAARASSAPAKPAPAPKTQVPGGEPAR